MKCVLLAITIALASLTAGCASDAGLREADRLALYTAHAGAPVPSFRYFGSLNGWTPLGEDAVALWTRPNQAYLVSFKGRCPDLDFASAISVSSQFNTVYTNFDKVVALNSGTTFPCHIGEIRPLDVKAIKQAEREMRANAQVSERP